MRVYPKPLQPLGARAIVDVFGYKGVMPQIELLTKLSLYEQQFRNRDDDAYLVLSLGLKGEFPTSWNENMLIQTLVDEIDGSSEVLGRP